MKTIHLAIGSSLIPVRATARVLAALALIGPLAASSPRPPAGERTLSFYHTHTGERLEVAYYRDGTHDEEALARLNLFLRDFRTGDEIEMDPALFDILYELRDAMGGAGTYEVISAYRSKETNAMLRERSSGVASNSQHVLGKAIDVRLSGVATNALRDAALELKRGGVGYYRKSDFVHVDTGRVRRW